MSKRKSKDADSHIAGAPAHYPNKDERPGSDDRRPYRDVFAKAFGDQLEGHDISAHQLTGQLHKTYHLLGVANEEFLRPYGLTTAKFRMLMWLLASERAGYDDGLLPSMLSRFHGVSPNTTSSLIAGMEQQSLLRREKHPTDNRKTILRLTDSGRELVEHIRMDFDAFSRSLVSGLSKEERDILITLLEKMSKSISVGNELCLAERGVADK